MGRNTASVGLLLALAMALAACTSSKTPDVAPNVFPTNYKQEIIDTLKQALDDTANVRDAAITEPVLRQAGKEERYIVCVRTGSRSAAGQSTGPKDRIAYFYGGHLNQMVEATKEQCGNALYKPFPELEKACVGQKCG
jgi:hypothetical protein